MTSQACMQSSALKVWAQWYDGRFCMQRGRTLQGLKGQNAEVFMQSSIGTVKNHTPEELETKLRLWNWAEHLWS